MGITFDESTGIFHLRAGGASYVMRLTPERDVLHLHWGKAIERGSIGHICRPAMRAFSPGTHPDNPDMSYDTLPLEYPFYGSGDFRSPAFGIR
ncbi:MAG: alpha-galactosidase, partial [Spirochaetes bacterium]|nr:alpha-galactosidase [Spirochaetota bacterium]